MIEEMFRKFDNDYAGCKCVPKCRPLPPVTDSSMPSEIRNVKGEVMGVRIQSGVNSKFYFDLVDHGISEDLFKVALTGKFSLDIIQMSGDVVATLTSRGEDISKGELTAVLDDLGVAVEVLVKAGLPSNVYYLKLTFTLDGDDTVYTLFTPGTGLLEVR